MKTHSRVQYTATIGDRVRTSAQAKTMAKWLLEYARASKGTVLGYGVDVRNIYTGEETSVHISVGGLHMDLFLFDLLRAKTKVGA